MTKYTSTTIACLLLLLSSCKEDAAFEVRGVEFGIVKAIHIGNGIQFSTEIMKTNGTIIEQGLIVTRHYDSYRWSDISGQSETTYIVPNNTPLILTTEADFELGLDCTAKAYAKIGERTYLSNPISIKAPTGAAPVITSISPTHGPVGTIITIEGKNFSSAATRNTVIASYDEHCFDILEQSNEKIIAKFKAYSYYSGKDNYLSIKIRTGSLTCAQEVRFDVDGWSIISFSPERPCVEDTLFMLLDHAGDTEVIYAHLYKGDTNYGMLSYCTRKDNYIKAVMPQWFQVESGAQYCIHLNLRQSSPGSMSGLIKTPSFTFREKWEATSSTPSQRTGWLQPTTYEGDLYYKKQGTGAIIQYSPATASWKEFPKMSLPENYSQYVTPVFFAHGGYIYSSNDNVSNEHDRTSLYKMNIATGQWSQLGELPTQDNYIGQVTTNENVYILMAESQYSEKKLYKYHISTDQWTQVAVLPSNIKNIIGRNNELYATTPEGFSSINLTNYSLTDLQVPAKIIDIYSGFMEGDCFYLSTYYMYYKYNVKTKQLTTLSKPAVDPILDYTESIFFSANGNLYICSQEKLYRYIGD